MNDDDLSNALGRLASSLAPPADTVARVGARVERRRRRRTTSLAVVSVVAVLGGGGVASAVAGGADQTAPALGSTGATPRPVLPTLPAVPVASSEPLDGGGLTYDPHNGTLVPASPLPPLPSALTLQGGVGPLHCHGDSHPVPRSFADILTGGAPSIEAAVGGFVRKPRDEALEILRNGDSAVVFVDRADSTRRLRFDVFHGFDGWVWLDEADCTAWTGVSYSFTISRGDHVPMVVTTTSPIAGGAGDVPRAVVSPSS